MKVLETKRMILRSWNIDDLDDFYEYAQNAKVGPNAGWKLHKNKEVSLKILQSFIEKDEVRVIEKCGFKYEGILRLSSKIFDESVFHNLENQKR